jgi:hypothetical protein
VGSQKEGALAAPCAQYAVLHSEQARRGLGWPCEQQTGSQYVHVPTQQPIRVEGSNSGARLLPPRSARRASLRARACELAARKHIAGKRLSSALTSACEGGQRTDARRMPRATPPQISELLPPPKLGPTGVYSVHPVCRPVWTTKSATLAPAPATPQDGERRQEGQR